NQMKGTSTFNSSVPSLGSLTNGNPAPTGNPILVGSVKDGFGNNLQYVLPETLTLTCKADSYSGKATAFQETYTLQAEQAVSSSLAFNWPGGSGASISMTAVNPAGNNNTAGNLLVNSDFETATTTNQPDNWTKDVGTIGSTILQGTGANAYTPTVGGFLEFLGNGSELTSVYQSFNTTPTTTQNAGGTGFNISTSPNIPFALNFWYKLGTASPAAGVLEVALTDGAGTIIQDDAGTNNDTTVTLTGIADTNFHNVNAVFRLPKNPPATIRLRVRLSTALTNTDAIYISRMSLAQMTALYTGGPYWSLFSGATKGVVNDPYTLAVSQTWGTFQEYFQRFFNMTNLGLIMPNSGTPTVADTLVT
ncbi:MAG: hypothetical protein KGL39_51605, partial [Patescibacteria group bacterium]|nr:hypothetical protein [Patescibacteria group bacterium]